MVKTKNPNLGTIIPQNKPTSLNEKERQQELKNKGKGKLSELDRARIASNAGFQKLGPKKKKFDIGDGSQLPYSLPEDDVDTEEWSQNTLSEAQGSMQLVASQMGEIGEAGSEVNMGAALVGSSFLPGEDNDFLEELAKKSNPPPEITQMKQSIADLGIDIPENESIGTSVLAAGLVVAGEKSSVVAKDGQLEKDTLAKGIQKTSDRANKALGEANRMNKGIGLQVAKHRTMFRK